MRTKAAIPMLMILLLLTVLVGMSLPAWAVSEQQEIDLGKRIDAQILKEEPLAADLQAQKEIDDMGQRIVKNVRRPQIPYHFKILEDSDLNAFSIPGGYVYFTNHLWNVLRPEEREGVLAHEIVHVDRRHALDALSKAQRRSFILGALLTIVGANQTVGSVVDVANQLYTLKYSRGDERQADEVGVQLLQQSGMNPAGLLMSMRKIERFQDQAGGQTPTILSTHPQTPERIKYLEQLLVTMRVPIPPEAVRDENYPYRLGSVASISGNKVTFSTTQLVPSGSVVWLMAPGWDYHYENRTQVPVARAVVIASPAGPGTASAVITPLPSAKPKELSVGVGIFSPPAPSLSSTAIKITPIAVGASGLGTIASTSPTNRMDRYLAEQIVWDAEANKPVTDNVGYVVITNPANPTGYVAATRSKYSYAPPGTGSALQKVSDPDNARWIGPVVSIGRGGETIEVLPNRTLEQNKTYEVVEPQWNSKTPYKERIVGTAVLVSRDKKIVLKMSTYNNGWSINDIQNGFDIYEPVAEGNEQPKVPSK